jgi:hypothetical protein
MMLKTLIEQSSKRENDFLQYCTVGEDYFKLIDVRFDVPTCLLTLIVTLAWMQEAWIKGTAITYVYVFLTLVKRWS